MELRSVDPSTNRYRCYRLVEQKTLFGETALVIHWGRLGQPFRCRTEIFPSDAHRAKRRETLLQRRRRNGYTAIV
jgi:predicted DNA-binding WGR domain protein